MSFFIETFAAKCDIEGGELTPQIILFAAQVLFGIAEAIYYVFGLSYLDDNVSKSKSPLMISELNRFGIKNLLLIIKEFCASK